MEADELAGVGHALCAPPIGHGAITTVTGDCVGAGAAAAVGHVGVPGGVDGVPGGGVDAVGTDAAGVVGDGVAFVAGGVTLVGCAGVGGVVVTCATSGIGYARSFGANSRLSTASDAGA